MTEKRFTHEKWYDERKIKENGELFAIVDVYNQADKICNRLNELFDENEKLKKERLAWLKNQEELECLSEENKKLKQIDKGQELEIVRLHGLADAMSSVLRELGIYDVYNEEQINSVKERLR